MKESPVDEEAKSLGGGGGRGGRGRGFWASSSFCGLVALSCPRPQRMWSGSLCRARFIWLTNSFKSPLCFFSLEIGAKL